MEVIPELFAWAMVGAAALKGVWWKNQLRQLQYEEELPFNIRDQVLLARVSSEIVKFFINSLSKSQ